jgi:uncharacterized protein YbjT (DUF2867 family)
MKKILLAGITGYLGSHIAAELHKRAFPVRAIARDPGRLNEKSGNINDIVTAELTQPETIGGCCKEIDIVISTVGITRQKDGLTYMDVDYQANMNLLQQAKLDGVKKFIYVSVLNGESLRHLKMCDAKEMFVEQLKASGIDFCVIRPNGFFSDMAEIYSMAKKGRIYLFGNGELRANPIHGQDLAKVCVDAIEKQDEEIKVGGPQTLTQKQMAVMAFDVLGKKPKITYIPAWVRTSILNMVRILTGSKVYGPIEFFLTVMAMDMLAPEYGRHTLKKYFSELREKKG